MNEQEPRTCGQGLAANSWLPAKLSDVISAMADVLEHHSTAVDKEDETGRKEFDAYESLVHQYREIAVKMKETANEMKGYRDLPMTDHDMAMMTSPVALAVFERLIRAKQELRQMLDETSSQDAKLLAEMRG